MSHPLDICVGSNLHLLRIQLGHSIESAAKIINVAPNLWEEWEAGQARLDANDIWELKAKFNINPSDLYIGLIDTTDQD